MRDEMALYQQHHVRPFGVNPAPATSHAEYAARLTLPFVLLSDPEAAIANAYHAAMPWGFGITRTVYLIGQDGRIQFGRRGAPGASVSLEHLESKK